MPTPYLETTPIASAYCLSVYCEWRTEGGLAIVGGEAQRHADETDHVVHVTAEIRKG